MKPAAAISCGIIRDPRRRGLCGLVRRLYGTMMRFVATLTAAMAMFAGTQLRAQVPTPSKDWEIVRTVPNEQGGTMDFVVVPERRQRDRAYYETIANTICSSRAACMVHFWTDRAHVPTSVWMSGAGLSQMTADYERSPGYKAPVLRLACWLYASKIEAENAKCFYLPGAKVPWPK